MVVAVVLWVPRLTGPLDLRYDAGAHYVLGTALAESHGYRFLNEPGAIEATRRPPLLAMIVAAHEWVARSSDPAVAGTLLRRTWAALFVIYGLGVWALARRWLSRGWAVVATLLVLLHLDLLWLSDTLVPELPFACATVLFLLVAERDDRRGVAALLGAAAYLLRASGLALLAAWVVDALLDRRWLEATLRAGLAALPILVWHSYVSEVETSAVPAYAYQYAPYQLFNVSEAANRTYIDPLAPERGMANRRDRTHRVIANALALPEALGESVSVRAEGPLAPVARLRAPDGVTSWSLAASRAACAAIGFAAAAGLVLLAVDGIRLAPLYFAAAVPPILTTPWPGELGRLVMPLAPLAAIGLVLALANAERLASRSIQTVVYAAAGILLGAQLTVLAVVFGSRHEVVAPTQPGAPQRLFFYGPHWRAHDAGLAWLARDASPASLARDASPASPARDASPASPARSEGPSSSAPREAKDPVVATSTPHRLYLATGLHAILPPFEADPEKAERLLEDVPVEYLVIDDLDFLDVAHRYGDPVVAAHPERWRLVYGGPDGGPRIYRRVDGGRQ